MAISRENGTVTRDAKLMIGTGSLMLLALAVFLSLRMELTATMLVNGFKSVRSVLSVGAGDAGAD